MPVITDRYSYHLSVLLLLVLLSACSSGLSAQDSEQASFLPIVRKPFPLDQYVVIAQLNLWYFGDGCYGGFEAHDCSGRRTVSLDPELGYTYYSSDPTVIHQQIEWAIEYGIDAFSLEWTTPRGIPGSLEPNIDDAFLKADNLPRVRWCIFYDTVLRLLQTPGLNVDLSGGIDFDDPEIYEIFVSDIAHFADKYFGHPQYLNVDGRPVIYVWASWNFKGGFSEAVQDARAEAEARGFDIFIVGEEVRAGSFNPDHASVFDANTAFTFLIPGISPPADVGEAAKEINVIFDEWRRNLQGIKVFGRDEYVGFQPSWSPQYDDRLFNLDNPTYVPALSKSQVITMAETARKHAEPIGSMDMRLVWLNTFNNWAETTTIEPTKAIGPKYPAGNYQYDMLEVVQQVFGGHIFFDDN